GGVEDRHLLGSEARLGEVVGAAVEEIPVLAVLVALDVGQRDAQLEELGLVALEFPLGGLVAAAPVVLGEALLEFRPRHRLVGVGQQRHEIEEAFGAVHGGRGSMWTKNPGPSRLAPMVACEVVQASGRVRALQPTVFSEFSALAARSGAVNLGQGFPDFDGPEVVREAAVEALRRGADQRRRGLAGVPRGRAMAHRARGSRGLTVTPDAGVLVTWGATEAVFDVIRGLVDPGEEVVGFEPVYGSYAASVAMAGGVMRPV